MINRRLGAGGCPALKPRNQEYKGKIPDGVLQVPGCEYPPLVIEIGWSQDKHDVENKAKYYLENFDGQIRTVIGINLRDTYTEQDAVKRKWASKVKKFENGKLSQPPEPLTFLAPEAVTRAADFSVWRAECGRRSAKTKTGKKSVQNQVCLPIVLVYCRFSSLIGFV
jgi:hypothetical protein